MELFGYVTPIKNNSDPKGRKYMLNGFMVRDLIGDLIPPESERAIREPAPRPAAASSTSKEGEGVAAK
jgi:hypothetical protein